MTVALSVERLTAHAIAENVALARAVGWPDVESDWRVVHAAAVVLGVRRQGRLIAQCALGLYGNAGTVAKMIVAPDFQRQALGRHLLDALLHLAERRSITVLGLVATPFGRPLYEQRQFTPVGETVTLVGTPDLPEAAEPAAPLPGVDVALRVEQRWMACSRLPMLRARFQEATATSSLTGADGEVCSYAMATAQGALTLVGPIIAQTDGHARSLLCSLLGSLQGPARIDVPAEQRQFRDWLQSVGFCEQNARVAMIRGAGQLPWQVPQRFALAAQAWG